LRKAGEQPVPVVLEQGVGHRGQHYLLAYVHEQWLQLQVSLRDHCELLQDRAALVVITPSVKWEVESTQMGSGWQHEC
jgi:hypothetical protein